jgi:preprotein translocase subunit SecF
MHLLQPLLNFRVNRHRRQVWLISGLALLLSLIGLVLSWLDPTIAAPLRPGLDFTGGTQIQLDRNCGSTCGDLTVSALEDRVQTIRLTSDGTSLAPNLMGSSIQLLDNGRSVVMRLPSLSPEQVDQVMGALDPLLGEQLKGSLSVDTIGPTSLTV